jgi:hypothetical protein
LRTSSATEEILASSKIDPNNFINQGNVLSTETSRIANAGYISFGLNPPTFYGDNEGVFIGYDNGPKVSLYSNYNNYFQWDGTKLLIQAVNFTLDMNGNITAHNADLSGKITATEGYIGGWTLTQDHLFSDLLSLNSLIPAITMGAATDYLNGTGLFIGKNSSLYKLSIGDPNGEYLAWDGEHLLTSGRWIGSTAVDPTLQEWKSDIVFSSIGANTVNWTGGFISLSDGITNYTIASGTTGVMSALTYVYLDVAVSLTALQVSTLFSDAVGDGKILVATAQNNTTGASIIPYTGQQPIIDGSQIIALSILAGQIAASSITADKLNVYTLSAITADMGNLNVNGLLTMIGDDSAITIGSPTAPTSSIAGTGIWIDKTGIYGLKTGASQFEISAITGGATFAGGNGTIDNGGINLNGLRYALRHLAYDPDGNNGRYSSMEMVYPNGSTIPALRISFFDKVSGTSVFPNGDFATGDFTNWTVTGSLAEVTTINRAHLRLDVASGVLGSVSIVSDKQAVTEGKSYSITYNGSFVTSSLQITTFGAFVNWYSVSNTLISTNTLPTPSGWSSVGAQVTAPAGATQAEFKVIVFGRAQIGHNGWGDIEIDDINMLMLGFNKSITLSDTDLIYNNGNTDIKLGVAGPTWGASVTDGQDKTADTAASFNQQCTTIKSGQDLRVTNVLWDLPYTGDYELWLMNTQAVTDTWAKLWSGTVSVVGEINMALANPLVIHGGSTVFLSVKKLSTAVKFGSKNVSSYKGTDFYLSGHWFDGSANAGYTPGVKLTYQIGTWG